MVRFNNCKLLFKFSYRSFPFWTSLKYVSTLIFHNTKRSLIYIFKAQQKQRNFLFWIWQLRSDNREKTSRSSDAFTFRLPNDKCASAVNELFDVCLPPRFRSLKFKGLRKGTNEATSWLDRRLRDMFIVYAF